MKLHFGDEQFEVDAAQLSIAFTQVTLWGEEGWGVGDKQSECDQGEKETYHCSHFLSQKTSS